MFIVVSWDNNYFYPSFSVIYKNNILIPLCSRIHFVIFINLEIRLFFAKKNQYEIRPCSLILISSILITG